MLKLVDSITFFNSEKQLNSTLISLYRERTRLVIEFAFHMAEGWLKLRLE